MARREDLKKWREALKATFPIVGGLRRKWAMDALAVHRNDRDVVPLLNEALRLTDEAVAGRAAKALADLTTASAVDALCALWAQKRDERLGQIIAQRKYVATAPAQVRVLSGLKAGANDVLSQVDTEPIAVLVVALDDADAVIRQNALTVLQRLQNQKGVDALCALWAQKRDERLGQIIAQRNYVATAPAQVRVLSGLKAGANDVLSQADAEPVAHLVAALGDTDAGIRASALAVLQGLRNAKGVDALCALWAQKRDERLGQLIAQRKYVASEPLQLKILTAFKCGKKITSDRPDLIPHFAKLLDDADNTVCSIATQSLEQLAPGAAQDALCEEAIRNPAGSAAKLCVRTHKRPADHERACLFLFLMRQFDEYLKEDYEFQNVRLELQRADAALRASIMEVYRSGDNRVAGLIEAKPKTLGELSDAELRHFVQVCTRHRDWPRLFQATLKIPLKYSLAALASLRQSQWEPESADLRSLYRQMLSDTGDQPPPPAKQPRPTSSLFEQWLARGASGEWSKLTEGELCQRLATATPPDGVAIVAALAAKRTASSAVVQTVKQNPNWFTRLAGYAAGLVPCDLVQDSVQDSNYWITELVSAAGVLEYWPGKSTHADVESVKTLSAAPPEAWAGKLGAARKVLQAILSYSNTGIRVEDFVIGPSDYAVVVEDAD